MFTRMPARKIAIAADQYGNELHARHPDGSRRLVVELRDTPAELIPKRLAKALLALRLRPAGHIQMDAHEQDGGGADDRHDEIPAGYHIIVVVEQHSEDHHEEDRHEGDENGAREVNHPFLRPSLRPELRLILPQRQPEKRFVDAVQRGRVLRPPDLHQIVEIHDSASSARLPASADLIRLIFTPTLLSVMPTMAAISL